MAEKSIENRIRAWFRCVGAWEVKFHADGIHGRAGVPDVLVCYRGLFIAVEVKQPGKGPSKLQAATMADIEAAGGIAFVATSIDDVVQELTRRGIYDGAERQAG